MSNWTDICALGDIPPNSGRAALLGDIQIAIYHLPDAPEKVFAIGNFDPLGKANVMSRGILGSLNGERVVASPLYKQHFRLSDGQCLEDESVKVPSFMAKVEGDRVLVAA